MTEPDEVKELIYDIENSNEQKLYRYSTPQSFQLKPYELLISNLSGSCGDLFVRAILHEINFDEHHVFKWRLEHKLNQYYVLNHYCPGCMPISFSFSKLLNEPNGYNKIKNLLLEGFFIKQSLGDASFSTKSWDKSGEFETISKMSKEVLDSTQPYILQKRLNLQSEYRIHSFCREIIPALSYLTQGLKSLSDKSNVENFLKQVLENLPLSVSEGAFIAWDIGVTANKDYFVIEANFTGFHPDYRAGFQTTGYVDDYHYGPIICAWLNKYFNLKFGVSINGVESSLYQNYPFYRAFVYYDSILKNTHIKVFENKINGNGLSAVIYLDQENLNYFNKLIRHFLLVDFAEKYYLITPDAIYPSIRNFYWENDKINVFGECDLFTEDQYNLIKRLDLERRRQICRFHLLRKHGFRSYIFI